MSTRAAVRSSRRDGASPGRGVGAGSCGAALAPPACGIGVVDGAAAGGPLQLAAPREEARPAGPRARVQAKLAIGRPNDPCEQEADRVARQVVRQIQDAAPAGPGEPAPVQRQAALPAGAPAAVAGGEAPPDLAAALDRARGGGRPLETGLRRSMGRALGVDFSGVRVHTDARSDLLSRSIRAKAFTSGTDVFFRQGAFAPGSRQGQELIAHELTHVVQQNDRVRDQGMEDVGRGPAGKEGGPESPSAVQVTRRADSQVQRLFGFEAELSVPTYKPGAGHPLKGFFFGGYPPTELKTSVGRNDAFKLMPDNGPHKAALKSLRLALGPFIGSKELDVPSKIEHASKLEYVSFAFDEMEGDAEERLEKQCQAVQDHARAVLREAREKTTDVPAPAVGMACGVPAEAVEAFTGQCVANAPTQMKEQVEAAAGKAREAVAKVVGYVKDEVDLQVTFGVLPSALPRLYEQPGMFDQAEGEGKARESLQASRALVLANAERIIAEVAAADEDWKKRMEANGFESRAFRGWVYTLCAYLIGDTLSQMKEHQTSTAKNTVPFLAKYNVGRMARTMPAGGPLYGLNDKGQEVLEETVLGMEGIKENYWVDKYGLELKRAKERLVYDSQEWFLRHAIQGEDVKTITWQGPQDQSAAEFQKADPVSEAVGKKTAGQQGYAVEARRLTVSTPVQGMFGELVKLMREVKSMTVREMERENG